MANKGNLDFRSMGARIRLAREGLNLTRERFAEIVELSPFYIGQIERGDRRMSVNTLVKIADCLHQSVDYLIYGKAAHESNIQRNSNFSVLESMPTEYEQIPDEDLRELFLILSQVANKNLVLFKDLIKLILPYVNR